MNVENGQPYSWLVICKGLTSCSERGAQRGGVPEPALLAHCLGSTSGSTDR
jgi:hypothetical protein